MNADAPDSSGSSGANPRLLLRALIWGGMGGVATLVALSVLMMLSESAATLISKPLEAFNVWLFEVWGISLFGYHEIAAAFFWCAVYLMLIGFIAGFGLRLFIAFLRRLPDSGGQRAHANT